jgi:predicted DNA-binding transcriptional regulator AlpA
MTINSSEKKFIELKAAASQLDIFLRGLYRLIANADLPRPVKIGGCRKFFITDLENYYKTLDEKRTKNP